MKITFANLAVLLITSCLGSQASAELRKPIRSADVRAVFYRHTLISNTDGKFEFKREKVCDEAITFNVYDSRNGRDKDKTTHFGDMFGRGLCSSKIGDQEVDVLLGGFIQLIDEPKELSDLGITEYKGIPVFLWTKTKDGNFFETAKNYAQSITVVGSLEMGASTTILTAEPSVQTRCPEAEKSCSGPQHPVYFSATILVKDPGQ